MISNFDKVNLIQEYILLKKKGKFNVYCVCYDFDELPQVNLYNNHEYITLINY